MQASSSKNVHQCLLGVCSHYSTFLRHMSLITLARQVQKFILQLGTTSLFGGMQMPRRLSIATSGRVLVTSKERSLVSLFFLSLVLEPESCLNPDFNPTRRSTKLLLAIFWSALIMISSIWLLLRLENGGNMSIASTSITSFVTFGRWIVRMTSSFTLQVLALMRSISSLYKPWSS
jgi:hypothetical protein